MQKITAQFVFRPRCCFCGWPIGDEADDPVFVEDEGFYHASCYHIYSDEVA
jgi:hypothetical protein